MSIADIKGPKDYAKFYHTNSAGDIWLDGKNHPIPLEHPLTTHVSFIDAKSLWHARQTRSKIHPQVSQPQKGGPYNSTSLDNTVPPLSNPASPIKDTTVDMSNTEDLAVTVVKELTKDKSIKPNLLSRAIQGAANYFSPSKPPPHEIEIIPPPSDDNSSEGSFDDASAGPHTSTQPITHMIPPHINSNSSSGFDQNIGQTINHSSNSTSSATSMTVHDLNRELNLMRERMKLECENFKKDFRLHLEQKANIELECQRLDLKRHFDNEIKQRDLTHQQTIRNLESKVRELTSHIQVETMLHIIHWLLHTSLHLLTNTSLLLFQQISLHLLLHTSQYHPNRQKVISQPLLTQM